MIKAIIFDFDGVIAESNDVKTEVFVRLFKKYPSYVTEQIRKFHLRNGGMSRFDKFRYIYANILERPLSDEKFSKLCDDFKRFVFEGVVNAPAVLGIENFLKRNKSKYRMYVASGTPQEEIIEIVKRRKLSRYFYGVYGSPTTKEKIIKNILRENAHTQKEVVFLGDSINDYEGAVGAGIDFVAKVSGSDESNMFSSVNLKTKIGTIEEFQKYLDQKEE
ncbi:HAD family hydrolase [Candidatus Omnitrophota bacterium]